MAEKTRLTEEQKEQNRMNIAKIAEYTAKIKEIVPNLHGKACITAYENSVSNLETKNEKYTTNTSFQVSNEEKELLTKLREGKIKISEIPADESTGTNINSEISENEMDEMTKHESKSKKKNR